MSLFGWRPDQKKSLRVQIPRPCWKTWQELEGNHRQRFCDDCQYSVHNLSSLTADEAKNLLRREGKICAAYYPRPDGSVWTQPEKTPAFLLYRFFHRLPPVLAAACLAAFALVLSGCSTADHQVVAEKKQWVPPPESCEPSAPAPMSKDLVLIVGDICNFVENKALPPAQQGSKSRGRPQK